MDKARLAILEAELKKQKEETDKIYSKIKQRTANLGDEAGVESMAYQLHNLYCGYEDMFKIIADAFENNVEEGVSWHKEILRRMSISINGIRPNLIGEDALYLLSELRAFRHFFRHAYTYQLDVKKIKLVLESALKLKDVFEKDADRFIRELKKEK